MSSAADAKKKTFLEHVGSFLKKFSFGKYESVFYHRGTNMQSSVIGGLISIAFTIVLLTFATMTMIEIIKLKHYNLDDTAKPI